MKTPYLIAAIGCVLILAAVIFAGCTESTTPSPVTPVAQETAAPANAPAGITPQATIPAAGTTTVPTPSTTSSFPTVLVNSSSNGDILTVPANERVLVRLSENPTTGYSWNATASKGLSVVYDAFTPPNSALIGAGGTHEWILAPDTAGTYTFKAIYLRPWEGALPTDDTFSLVIVATPE